MNHWELAYCENRKCETLEIRSRADIERLGFPVIPAEVPGNFETDMMRAGLLPDLFFSENTLLAQRLENLHLWYMTEVDVADPSSVLHFEGVDTVAEVFVNGKFVGGHDNMFTAFELSPDFRVGKNELLVHIRPVCIAARDHVLPPSSTSQRYNYPSMVYRKAGHMFGWDIMPRIVSGGIWKPVTLKPKKSNYIRDVYAATVSLGGGWAGVNLHYSVAVDGDFTTEYSIKVRGTCRDSSFSCEDVLWHTDGLIRFSVKNPYLWWPKNCGSPDLYDVTVELYRGGEPCDCYRFNLGIRQIRLISEDMNPDGTGGEFRFEVNGKKVFILGTNWVPVSPFHGSDGERYPKALALLDDIGCNMVRCWGGNVYESDTFYDFCDRHGILVWQDFSMGCACYPNDERSMRQLEEEAVFQIKRLRNHASLALWAGDNECDAAATGWNGVRIDPGQNLLTRQVLKRAVMTWDYARCYLPSSPYISENAYRDHLPLQEDHLWGPRDYFKGDYYRNARCHFASETGYHGFPSVDSLRTFLKEPEKLFDENGNTTREYLVHAACMEPREGAPYAYRIKLAYKQVVTLFGSAEPGLEDFVRQSQISQAEAKKYFIERFRIGKWRRTGIIWWNLLDGWPQVSDAVVDYYYRKKLAYSYIKRSQSPVCLMFDEPEESGTLIALHAVNDTPADRDISYRVTDLTMGRVVSEGTAVAKADESVILDKVIIEKGEKHFYFIEWTLDGIKHTNHYMPNIRDIDFSEYLAYIGKCGYDEFEGF